MAMAFSCFAIRAAMAISLLVVLGLMLCAGAKQEKEVTQLQIGVKYKPSKCTVKASVGDEVAVHYTGKLVDGTVFDSSLTRGDPISFTLGKGHVIKGWDRGIAGMCLGEKRKLKIPPSLGYGEHGSPPTIPGGATLIFETELISVNGVKVAESDRQEL
eukprot:TRINITY_DN6564_c0_g1_i4.p1 TRINITY_DN6564_c0_g1~~TRINITY_DN6564_c0_g1_i4.p1  ORF type:complete len:158 (-),score=40.71 TRINITY_DN6564_c0_g1_i4:404-877(-)